MHKYIFMLIALNLNLVVESDNSFYKNEWIPISENDILYRLKQNYVRSTDNVASNEGIINDTAKTSEDDEMKILRGNVIKMVTPQITLKNDDILNPFQKMTNQNYFQNISNKCVGSPLCSNNYKTTSASNFSEQLDITNKTRKSKAISEIITARGNNNNIEAVIKLNSVTGKQPLPEIKDAITEETHSTYEVIDNFKESESVSNHEDTMDNLKYLYPVPTNKLYMYGDNSFANTLDDILSKKYNIQSNDNLSNYALSRLDKSHEHSRKNVYIPIAKPYGYNTLNHLPVNPLLAVFLSNYGYYLPSLYGLHNNYKNLYGYLASNNIHNNLPFGYYKIFSDTDSSN